MALVADSETAVIQLLAQACDALIEGETMQLRSAWDPSLTTGRYLGIIERKTAALLATCAELGALAAGGTDEELKALRAYGRHLGLAFQIRDDVLDLVSGREMLGKPTASDLDRGLLSLAALHALRVCPELAASVRERDPGPLKAAILQTGSIEQAMNAARSQSENAVAALAPVPSSAVRDELVRLARWAADRDR